MSDATVKTVEEALAGAFSRLDQWLEEEPSTLHERPPRPDAWSIAEHLEHLTLVNRYLLVIIRKGVAKAVKKADVSERYNAGSDFAFLESIAIPGAFEWPPPLHMIPTGTAPMDGVHKILRQQKEECLELLGRMPNGEGSLHKVTMSVAGLGKIDMYQWLYFLAQHLRYHLVLMEHCRTEITPR